MPRRNPSLYDHYDKRKSAPKIEFRYMTVEEAKLLGYRDEVWVILNNGRAGRVRVSGRVRLWKRDADRIEVPVKYGMYESFTLERRHFAGGSEPRALVKV